MNNRRQLQHDKILRISSEDKQPGQTNTNFTVILNNSSYVQDVRSVVVKSVSFTNVFDNIFSDGGDPAIATTKANNVFSFRIDGAPAILDATVPPGFYNAAELATALEIAISDALVLAGSIISVGVTLAGVPNLKFTFSIAGGTVQFLQQRDPVTGLLQNRMANQIGIEVDSAFEAAAYTADWLPALQGIQEVYICSPELAEQHTIASSFQGEIIPVLIDLAVTSPFGAEVFYESNDQDLTIVNYSMAKQLTQINIQLCTRTGRVLDTQQNAVTLILQVLK